jgi:N-acetylneuraminate epimerase
VLGRTLYVAGGNETPTATTALKSFWALDLDASPRRWQALEPWPGPARMLAVAAAQDGAFYLMSGAELTADALGKPVRRYLKDAYRYRPGTGWQPIADLPRPAVAAPSPALSVGEHFLVVLGGDDGTRVSFQPPEDHPGFPRSRLLYNIRNDAWQTIHDLPAAPVTTTAVRWQQGWVIPSGEVRPGVRTPACWLLNIASD